jgi:hypothetical protein
MSTRFDIRPVPFSEGTQHLLFREDDLLGVADTYDAAVRSIQRSGRAIRAAKIGAKRRKLTAEIRRAERAEAQSL